MVDPRFRRERARLSADRVRVVAKACGRGQRSKRDAHKNRCASLLVEDWRAFGELAAGLLGADVKRVIDLRIVPSDVADHLSAAEVRLLRQLIRIERLDRLDGEIVRLRIQEFFANSARVSPAGKPSSISSSALPERSPSASARLRAMTSKLTTPKPWSSSSGPISVMLRFC